MLMSILGPNCAFVAKLIVSALDLQEEQNKKYTIITGICFISTRSTHQINQPRKLKSKFIYVALNMQFKKEYIINILLSDIF